MSQIDMSVISNLLLERVEFYTTYFFSRSWFGCAQAQAEPLTIQFKLSKVQGDADQDLESAAAAVAVCAETGRCQCLSGIGRHRRVSRRLVI